MRQLENLQGDNLNQNAIQPKPGGNLTSPLPQEIELLYQHLASQMEQQQTRNEARISELESQLVTQTAQIEKLNQKLSDPSEQQLSSEVTFKENIKARFLSRRKLLKGLGLVTAVVTVSSSAALGQKGEAQAASGDFLMVGNSNLASDTTYLSQVGGTAPSPIVWTDSYVWTDSNSTTQSTVNFPSGTALAATSNTGIGGFFQGNAAPILLQPASSATGAPISGNHKKGELYVDFNGSLFICQGDGTPGSWTNLSPLQLFPSGARVYSNTNITSGTVLGPISTAGVGVPSGAKAAYCSVQVNPTATGPLTLFPSDVADPSTANYVASVAGVLNLFYMFVPLATTGTDPRSFKIHTYVSGAIYVDVWGYLL